MKLHVSTMLAAACLLSVQVAAQQDKPFVEARGSVKTIPLPAGGPAPRMSDGHPDLSGVWFPGPTGKANAWSTEPAGQPRADYPGEQRFQPEPIPFQPWAKERRDKMTRVELELSSANVNCMPVGTPGMFTDNAYVHMIDTKPGLYIHLIENNNRWQVVHTDGRPHTPKEEQEPLFYGDQTAKWEGDVLVIDSVSIDERAQIQDGWIHSDQLHVIERLRRPNMNYLYYQYTIDDPKVLTKPWTSGWEVLSLGHEDLTENFCTKNENVEQLKKLYEEQNGGKTPVYNERVQ